MHERKIHIVRPSNYEACATCPLAGDQIRIASRKPGTSSIQIRCVGKNIFWVGPYVQMMQTQRISVDANQVGIDNSQVNVTATCPGRNKP